MSLASTLMAKYGATSLSHCEIEEISMLFNIFGLQEKMLKQEIDAIEKDTGFKLRVLAQNYPDTPGIYMIPLFDSFKYYN